MAAPPHFNPFGHNSAICILFKGARSTKTAPNHRRSPRKLIRSSAKNYNNNLAGCNVYMLALKLSRTLRQNIISLFSLVKGLGFGKFDNHPRRTSAAPASAVVGKSAGNSRIIHLTNISCLNLIETRFSIKISLCLRISAAAFCAVLGDFSGKFVA